MADERDTPGVGGLLVYVSASSECDGAHNKVLDFGENYNTFRISVNSTAAVGVSVMPSAAAGPVATNTPAASGATVPNPALFIAPGNPLAEWRMKDRFRYLAVKVFGAADASLLVEAYNS